VDPRSTARERKNLVFRKRPLPARPATMKQKNAELFQFSIPQRKNSGGGTRRRERSPSSRTLFEDSKRKKKPIPPAGNRQPKGKPQKGGGRVKKKKKQRGQGGGKFLRFRNTRHVLSQYVPARKSGKKGNPAAIGGRGVPALVQVKLVRRVPRVPNHHEHTSNLSGKRVGKISAWGVADVLEAAL